MRSVISIVALALSLAACSETATETAVSFGSATAEHGETANDYIFAWEGDAAVTLEMSTTPGFAAGEGETIGTFEGGSAEVSLEGDPERRYFLLTSEDGEEERVAVRLLPLEGGRNFRDIGGY